MKPGPRNLITDVPGLSVGQAEDRALVTGATVIVPDQPAVCAVDHRGGGIGSRDTLTLSPGSVVERIHALCLSGGSAFGLDAAGGVQDRLRRAGRGLDVRGAIVPIVPQAIIFDLLCGGPKTWEHPPWWQLGADAFDAAGPHVALGNAGAGLGATAGPLKGGLGSASLVGDFALGAIAVVNPMGTVVMPGTRCFWAWDAAMAGEVGPQRPAAPAPETPPRGRPGENTTLVTVATDVRLTREQALRVAIMAQDGLARAVRPAHSPFDGDTVFVMSTGSGPSPEEAGGLARIGALAADTVARAIMRGVYEAGPLAGFPAYRDLSG